LGHRKTTSSAELKPVTLEGSTTALLILDMMKANCAPARAALLQFPTSSDFTTRAYRRSNGVYSLVGSDGKATLQT